MAGDYEMASGDETFLKWAWVRQALEPPYSGDAAAVFESPGWVTVAVVDGLGHGQAAANAADAALAIISEHVGEELIDILAACHEGVRQTRGVALTLARVDAASGELSWLGIGNVEAVVWRVDGLHTRLATVGGVVGYLTPRSGTQTSWMAPSDVLVIGTDGMRSGFLGAPQSVGDPRASASDLFTAYARGTDDALVFTAVYKTSGSDKIEGLIEAQDPTEGNLP